jgi:hypothetical protein
MLFIRGGIGGPQCISERFTVILGLPVSPHEWRGYLMNESVFTAHTYLEPSDHVWDTRLYFRNRYFFRKHKFRRMEM